jgi:hypothetical protein
VLRDPLCYKLIWIAIADAANPATTGSHVHPAVSLPAAKAFVKRQFLWGKTILGVAREYAAKKNYRYKRCRYPRPSLSCPSRQFHYSLSL